ARYRFTGLSTLEGRARPAAIDHGSHVHPRNYRKAVAPLLVDQRMEGTGRCTRHTAGHRTDFAGLVLRGGARCRLGVDHRPGVFPAHGWHRALAVPPGTQTRWQTGNRLAIR